MGKTVADRVTAALANALVGKNPGMAHDDAVARVLSSNPDLARAYQREMNS